MLKVTPPREQACGDFTSVLACRDVANTSWAAGYCEQLVRQWSGIQWCCNCFPLQGAVASSMLSEVWRLPRGTVEWKDSSIAVCVWNFRALACKGEGAVSVPRGPPKTYPGLWMSLAFQHQSCALPSLWRNCSRLRAATTVLVPAWAWWHVCKGSSFWKGLAPNECTVTQLCFLALCKQLSSQDSWWVAAAFSKPSIADLVSCCSLQSTCGDRKQHTEHGNVLPALRVGNAVCVCSASGTPRGCCNVSDTFLNIYAREAENGKGFPSKNTNAEEVSTATPTGSFWAAPAGHWLSACCVRQARGKHFVSLGISPFQALM